MKLSFLPLLWLLLTRSAHAAAPAVPKEARRHFVKAVTFQKEAKSPSGFALAVAEYREALTLAPKWADARYNLALALESEGKFSEAAAEFKQYLKLKPKETEKIEDKLAALEAKQQLAQTAPPVPAKSAEDELVDSLNGAEFGTWDARNGNAVWYEIDGRQISLHNRIGLTGSSSESARVPLQGRRFTIPQSDQNNFSEGEIAGDGKSIRVTVTVPGAGQFHYEYPRR